MRRGFTVVELLVAIALLGLIGTLTGLGLASLRESESAGILKSLADAHAAAIDGGYVVPWVNGSDTLWFAPDGSSSGGVVVLDGQTIAIDPMTGAASVM